MTELEYLLLADSVYLNLAILKILNILWYILYFWICTYEVIELLEIKGSLFSKLEKNNYKINMSCIYKV